MLTKTLAAATLTQQLMGSKILALTPNINEIKDFANSDEVRRVGNKVIDVANNGGDASVDAGSAITDFFGRKKRSPGFGIKLTRPLI